MLQKGIKVKDGNVTLVAGVTHPGRALVRPFDSTRASVDGAEFRQAMRRRAAGVCVITTIGRDAAKLGLTATAVTSLSLDPPLVLVCIVNQSRVVAPLSAGAPFVVHFLAANQEELARRFATYAPDKFAGVGYHTTPSGCPRIEGVLASLECVVHAVFPGGDHTIFVGRVVDALFGNTPALPLVYFAGQYM